MTCVTTDRDLVSKHVNEVTHLDNAESNPPIVMTTEHLNPLELLVTNLKAELDAERCQNVILQEELKTLKSQLSILLTGAEAQEEFITNRLIKSIEAMKQERDNLVVQTRQEEENLANVLQKRLTEVRQEKIDIENQLEQEEEFIVNNLQRALSKLEIENITLKSMIDKEDVDKALIQSSEELKNINFGENTPREFISTSHKVLETDKIGPKIRRSSTSFKSSHNSITSDKSSSVQSPTLGLSSTHYTNLHSPLQVSRDRGSSSPPREANFRPRSFSLPIKDAQCPKPSIFYTWRNINDYTNRSLHGAQPYYASGFYQNQSLQEKALSSNPSISTSTVPSAKKNHTNDQYIAMVSPTHHQLSSSSSHAHTNSIPFSPNIHSSSASSSLGNPGSSGFPLRSLPFSENLQSSKRHYIKTGWIDYRRNGGQLMKLMFVLGQDGLLQGFSNDITSSQPIMPTDANPLQEKSKSNVQNRYQAPLYSIMMKTITNAHLIMDQHMIEFESKDGSKHVLACQEIQDWLNHFQKWWKAFSVNVQVTNAEHLTTAS